MSAETTSVARPPSAVWRRALSWAATAGVLMLLALAIALAVIPAMHKGTALTVLTGSMQPTMKPGDVAVVYPVEGFEDIKLGDIVTFMPNAEDPTLVSHRAVRWETGKDGERLLVTRGDANGQEDPPLMEKQVRAKVAYHVPWVGNVLQYGAASKPWLVIGLGVVLITYSLYATLTSFRRK
jgi:signal peptidase